MSDLFGNWERKEGLDTWTKGHGLVTQGAEKSCSFCGSLHPDTFMEWIDAGAEVGPTDKNYKAYIRGPQGEAKFYYLHLDTTQRRQFVNLYNDGTMKIGYPHTFHVNPFFMADVPENVMATLVAPRRRQRPAQTDPGEPLPDPFEEG